MGRHYHIDAIARDLENMYAIHSIIPQAITENLSFAVGYVHSEGRHIPVYRNINPINPTRSWQTADPF